MRRREVADIAWSPTIAGIARATGASVLPIYFSGRNSTGFQLAGLVSPRLRTLLLPRELLKKRGSTIHVQIGSLISPLKLREFDSDEEMAAYLRVRTYLLAGRATKSRSANRPSPRVEERIAPAEPVDLIESELASLPSDQHLAASGALRVAYARAEQIPTTLREIGRLREITFRRAGEGTGRSADLDRFDEYYLHLLVHDSTRRQVVGAYRLGLTDHILPAHGKDGLYTHTLFRFSDELLKQIGPAIELGRSFVRPEYQKEFAPLMLLWKGIALFAARYPQYRRLFGPVSISNEYQSLTRQLLIEFLKINASSNDLHKLVSARHPPRFGPGRSWQARLAGTIVRTIEGIDELIGDIESDRRGSPVLLRQYLKLNAKLLGFNVDPEFGDVLDGLMLVDLAQVQRAILVRYMGRENATNFLAHHGVSHE
jgi:putative hemolysin